MDLYFLVLNEKGWLELVMSWYMPNFILFLLTGTDGAPADTSGRSKGCSDRIFKG